MLQEVTVAWECQRLLLFIVYLDDQGNDADDQNTELKQAGIGHHVHHPPPMEWRRKQEEVQPPPEGGAPPTATGSAWVDYSILCRIWQDTGYGLPRRGFAPPRNDRTGDAGPLRPLRGHLPQGGRQGSVGFSGPVLAPPVGELARRKP